MEKLQVPGNDTNTRKPSWDPLNFSMEIQPKELNSSVDCFFNPSWDNSIDQNDPFESSLSSIVSSPTGSKTAGGHSLMMKELIGRLGSICNSGVISPGIKNSANASCYSTPLNYPPKSNDPSSIMENIFRGGNLRIPGNHLRNNPSLAPLNVDPPFIELAAKYSCFGNESFGGKNAIPKLEFSKLSRVSSGQSAKAAGFQVGNQENKNTRFEMKFGGISQPPLPGNAEFGYSREESPASEHNPGVQMGLKAQSETNSRKRKSTPKGKGKVIASTSLANVVMIDETNEKRSKPDEDSKNEKENTKENADQNESAKTAREDDEKRNLKAPNPTKPPKDYIHVRARRGQATISHSLAERVRREKISEKMKFLQDLVPGCNKVTGKAVVLDEIITYVQLLQRQVEFLSMKLAAVSPRMDFIMEALLSEDNRQMQPLPNGTSNGSSINPLNAAIHQKQSIQTPLVDVFNSPMTQVLEFVHKHCPSSMASQNSYEFSKQLSTFWKGNPQRDLQTGFVQNQTPSFHGQMKAEL
ncbi:hypothetical protein Nepgr_009899 [Nepenthes gracilis]|uniref:BHLH domain-containing protein n=1 Tax=Nepenthes gracilis TaxID=150966 RepID=A0AAD3SCA6_NEPGR|nr:hypothetical protein Nepgr_009899 [Nepenthes gracilis]